jgi:hypothetical protein
VAENNLDGIGRRLRAPGSQQVNAEELLAELVRLVESSRRAPERSSPPVDTVSGREVAEREQMQPLEMTPLCPSVEAPSCNPRDTRVPDVEPPGAPRSGNSHSDDSNGLGLVARRRSGVWTTRVSALVLVGAVGSIFWLEQIKSKPSEAPPFVAAAQSSTTVPPLSHPSVATSSDAEVTPPRDIRQPAQGKEVSSEERPIDVTARASLENQAPSQDLGPTALGVAPPTAPPAGGPAAAPVNTPALAAPVAATPPAAPQSLVSKAVPTVSLPSEPTPTAAPIPSTTDSGAAAQPSEAPLPPVRPAPKAAIQAGGVAQRSTLRLGLPPRLSSPSGAHVVAKTGATGPGALETSSEPLRRGASANPENGAKTLKAAQASVEAQAAPSQQPGPAAPQPNPNPVARAFGSVVGVVGAVAGLIPFAGH